MVAGCETAFHKSQLKREQTEEHDTIREIERDFHVRVFGEEMTKVNLDMSEEERRRYLSWMRKVATEHGVKVGRDRASNWMYSTAELNEDVSD